MGRIMNRPRAKKSTDLTANTATADAAEKEARRQQLARMTREGTVCGAAVIEAFQSSLLGKEVEFEPVREGLVESVKAIKDGDLRSLESMLFSQATALQAIFASLSRRASRQEYLKQYQTYLTLGLKAQAQSRATIEALIELKQPRQQPTFVKQANIAHGHQQVNNGTAPAVPGGSEIAAPAEIGNRTASHAKNYSPLGSNSEALQPVERGS
jgi:hypothetical protein